MGSTEPSSHFRVVQRFPVEYAPESFVQYESKRTGLRVVVVNQDGPKVFGYFALATEAHDDSGSPHTLEHLCFMGSKKYPFKSVLDKLATRAYSETNAWTDTDNTTYTLESAGWEGFAQILPVYLDHVIRPTLQDAACLTEVHHINGNGEDAGVVYSEMQGFQNRKDELVDLKMKRLLYPEDVGFRYETGGMPEQLRSLSADTIRAFHREMYQPKNLCLVVVGEIDHGNMLQILDEFEESILDDVPQIGDSFVRPWIDTKQALPLEETILEKIDFPEDDESSGSVSIAFLGPSCNDTLLVAALDTALVYLAGSSASILENTLVEREQICTAVYYETQQRPDTAIHFSLTGVDTSELAKAEARFFEVLRKAMDEKLDMQYMVDCVRRQRRSVKAGAESSPIFFISSIICDHLYAKRDGSSLKELGSLAEYDELEAWTEDMWRGLIKKWLSDANHISLLAAPSAKLAENNKLEEEARVKKQIEDLGEEGLARMEKRLQDAKAENEKEIPNGLLESFPVPGTDSIHFINTTTARSGSALEAGRPQNHIQDIVDKDSSDLPLYIHFEHIPSNFVQINLLINTSSIPTQLRPFLPIYIDLFFDSPIERDGKKLEFEQVVLELEKDTVSYDFGSAAGVGAPEVLEIQFRVEKEKYQVAIEWMKTMLWKTIFDIDRLKATTSRLLSDIPDLKRSMRYIVSEVVSMTHLAPESLGRARNTLVKAVFLKYIKRQLKSSPEEVISNLETIRRSLGQFSNMRAFVVADVTALQNPVSSWKSFLAPLDMKEPLKALDRRIDRLSSAGKTLGERTYIIPMTTTNSSVSVATAHGPTSYYDPRLPALMVAVAFLEVTEGPLWTSVRGTGLAYGAYFLRSTESGFIKFYIDRSPDAWKAFDASRKVLESFISGETALTARDLEGAISSIIMSMASEEPTMAEAALASFMNQVVKGVPKDFSQTLLRKVREIGVEDVKAIMKELLLPVLTPGKADVVVVCAPTMEEVSTLPAHHFNYYTTPQYSGLHVS